MKANRGVETAVHYRWLGTSPFLSSDSEILVR